MQLRWSTIHVDSQWGVTTDNPLRAHADGAATLAVFFPGTNYGCEAPLLYYARKAALLAGCDTLSLEYGFQAARRSDSGWSPS